MIFTISVYSALHGFRLSSHFPCSMTASNQSMIVYVVMTATLTLLLHLTLCVVTVSCVRGRDKAIRKRFSHVLINTDSSSS